MKEKPIVYVIVGPTASGKTDVGLKLAKRINGEIISADSMQIYKNLDIGTAKDKNLAVKQYLIDIKNVDEKYSVAQFVKDAGEYASRIVELPAIVESDSLETKEEGSYRTRWLKDLKAGEELNYVLDAAPGSFEDTAVRQIFINAATIFINAVMGLTPLFGEGSAAMYALIGENEKAQKLFGGGDTIQDFGILLPELFARAQKDESYYFFTGGGAVLDAIKQGSPYGMKPVADLIKE